MHIIRKLKQVSLKTSSSPDSPPFQFHLSQNVSAVHFELFCTLFSPEGSPVRRKTMTMQSSAVTTPPADPS
eukprot:1782807-Rhodomonas_salina.1